MKIKINFMKRSLTTIAFVLISIFAFSQASVDKAYVGVLSGTSFSLDSVYSQSTITVRIGSMLSYKFNNVVSMHGYGLYEASVDSSWTASSYWMKLKPVKGLDMEFGKVAALTTMHRPHPVSGDAQFEPYAYAQSPAGSLGAKASYKLSEKLSVGAGVFERKRNPDYQLGLIYGGFNLTGFYTDWNDKFGTVVSYNNKSLSSILVWKQDELLANTTVLKIGKKKDLFLVSNQGYDLKAKSWAKSLFVVNKKFNVSYFEGRIGMGYDTMQNSLTGYLLIYINK